MKDEIGDVTSVELLRGSFWLYAGSGISFLLAFLTNIALARLLDAELWGVFSICLAVVGLLATFCDLGLNYSATFYISRYAAKRQTKKLRAYLSALSKYKLVFILATCAFMYILANFFAEFFHAPNAAPFLQLSVLYLGLSSVFSYFDAIFIGLRRFKQLTLLTLLSSVIRFIVGPLLVFYGFGVNGAVLGYVLSFGISSLLMFYVVSGYFSWRSKEKVNMREAASYGFYVGIINLTAAILVWTDSFLIGFFMDPLNVGFYRIAITIALAIASFLAVANRAFFPAMAHLEAIGDRRRLQHFFDKAMEYGAFLSMPAVFGLALLAGPMVKIFFGNQYMQAVPALVVLSYMCFDTLVSGFVNSLFSALKKPDVVAKILCAFVVVNVLLNLALLPVLGIVGAAIAVVATRISSFIISVFLLRRMFSIGFDKMHIIKPLLASIVMTAVLYPLVLQIHSILFGLFVILLGVFIYFAVQAVLGYDVVRLVKRVVLLK
jgi:O-antigen/teichoic acid export membrane protein